MFNQIRAFLLSSTIVAVLLFSAVGTKVAYADGGTGTPPIDLGTAPSPEGASSVGTAPSPDSSEDSAPILDSVPDNTAVTVLNAEGQPEPLASQDAANAIVTSDPFWCPETELVPTPGINNCTTSFPSFTALLTFLSGNSAYQGPGVIYVQQGAYTGPESTVNFNNFNLSNLEPSSLTITGGWANNALDPNGTSSFNNVSLVIGTATNPWGGSLSLNNLTINDPTGTGITLFAQDDANLNKINVTNSTNGAGAELHAGNDVNINNSSFLRNKTAGAIIQSVRDTAIANSTFSNPVNARRQMVGLGIGAGRNVSLLNVLANENRDAGARINAGDRVTIGSSEFSGTKAMNGSAFIGEGLTVVAAGAIELNNVKANNNFLWGASLKAGGEVAIANSEFNGNTTESPGFIDDTGLLVTTTNGGVSLLNVRANDNRLLGATINATGQVTINNSEFLSNNGIVLDSAGNEVFHGVGLEVVTLGQIFLDAVNASGNTFHGALLDAGMDVNVSNSTFNNNTSLNNQSTGTPPVTGKGLVIISDRNVILDTVTLDGNQTFGASIQAGGAVFLDTVTATNNGTNGVEVMANCTQVFLIGGTYSNNGQYGLSVINGAVNQIAPPVFGGNGTGDIFQDPGTCIFTTTTTEPLIPPVDNGGTTPPTDPGSPDGGSSVISPSGAASAATTHEHATSSAEFDFSGRTVSAMSKAALNSLLANARLGGGSGLHIGLVMGKYALIYYAHGKQIIILLPASLNELAMGGS
jgi:hypothetical protein